MSETTTEQSPNPAPQTGETRKDRQLRLQEYELRLRERQQKSKLDSNSTIEVLGGSLFKAMTIPASLLCLYFLVTLLIEENGPLISSMQTGCEFAHDLVNERLLPEPYDIVENPLNIDQREWDDDRESQWKAWGENVLDDRDEVWRACFDSVNR